MASHQTSRRRRPAPTQRRLADDLRRVGRAFAPIGAGAAAATGRGLVASARIGRAAAGDLRAGARTVSERIDAARAGRSAQPRLPRPSFRAASAATVACALVGAGALAIGGVWMSIALRAFSLSLPAPALAVLGALVGGLMGARLAADDAPGVPPGPLPVRFHSRAPAGDDTISLS